MPEGMNEERQNLLDDLIKLRKPVSYLVERLRGHSWDVDHPIMLVSSADVVRTLEAYLSADISAETVTEWADALEAREDIECDERVSEFFMEASSPEIFEPISVEFARRWLKYFR